MPIEAAYEWTGPLPTEVNETAPFWSACDRGEFLIQRCRDCNQVQYHYRAICAHCWSDNVDDLPIAGDGTIWTFSVVQVNRSPQFASWGVYATGVVELPEGVKVISRIVCDDPHSLKIGDPVQLAFAKAETGQQIPIFVAAGQKP